MDKNDIIEYVMNTPHNTNKAVLSSMLNQLTEGGGGGSSDLSKANVSITYNGPNDDISCYLPYISNDSGADMLSYVTYVEKNSTKVVTAVKTDNGAVIDFDLYSEQDFAITGDIIPLKDRPGAPPLSPFLITGDCTITIS